MNGRAICPKCKRETLTYRPKGATSDYFVGHDHGDDECRWSHERVRPSQMLEPVSVLFTAHE